MQVHQFQVSYVAEQDRLLVRMNSTAGDEQGLWLTRRLMLDLFPHLDKAVHELSLSDPQTVGHDGAAEGAVRAHQQAETLGQSDFQTPYQEASPDAGGPLLVTAAHYQLLNKHEMSLRFDEACQGQIETRTVEIHMVSETALALLHVLRLGLQASGWGISGANQTDTQSALPTQASMDADTSDWDAFALAERPKYLN